jgi:16S rRNA processing protein RimM
MAIVSRSRYSTESSVVKLIVLGAITRAHGLKGEVEVLPFHAESPRWSPGSEVWLVLGGDPANHDREADFIESENVEPDAIVRSRPGAKGRLVVTLARCKNRHTADSLRGSVIGVPPEALEELEDDEFWFHEVSGWSVVTEDSEPVGTIVRAIDLTTQLFEVRPVSGGETFYIPIVDDVIIDIDKEAGRVTIHLLEGLLP